MEAPTIRRGKPASISAPATKNKDMSAFGDEFLGRRQPDARCAPGDNRDLAFE